MLYIDLAVAMGNYINIPITTRHLAEQYRKQVPDSDDFVLDGRTIELLVSAIPITTDARIQNFYSDWWSETESRSIKNALNYKMAPEALNFHIQEIKTIVNDVANRAVHSPAWPGSPGFGLAWGGFGFVKPQARPKLLKRDE